ncbi:DNA/RNA nuclease SfsA [Shewanella sp. NIFS-20-20]|uniref:DNA/RNA nuclease SfsA n=1 Tax=Shewanella sp. NIFS-20-20 TaxID=2853806 RepID=UPI001C48DB93|nr:DNA/RNA nuclease SfsA [Shewanella sp. NIFS-20-20]MBV7314136.1 DNA/RNA nuclease SfsA [Shewanella sp. NIFS-20-20]
MHFSPPLQSGRLIKRYKRFLTDVKLDDGSQITIHCPNTGSMKNCLFENEPLWYSLSDNQKRKYPGTFEVMTTPAGHLIGLNTGRANALAEEAIKAQHISELCGYDTCRREVKYGQENSRIDLLLSAPAQADCYIEVKSCTLLEGQWGYFPDAVTTRGQKHLRELMAMKQRGHRSVLLFVVQHTGIHQMRPAEHIDPDYCRLLQQAIDLGVEVLAYGVEITTDEIKIHQKCLFEK